MEVGHTVSLIRPLCPFELFFPIKNIRKMIFIYAMWWVFFFFSPNSSVPVRKTALSYTL